MGERVAPFVYYGMWDVFGVRPVWLLAFWTSSLILDEWNQWVVNPTTFEVDLWNRYDYISLSSSSIALLIKLFVGPVEHAVEKMSAVINTSGELGRGLGEAAGGAAAAVTAAAASATASGGRLLKAHGGGTAAPMDDTVDLVSSIGGGAAPCALSSRPPLARRGPTAAAPPTASPGPRPSSPLVLMSRAHLLHRISNEAILKGLIKERGGGRRM